MTTSVQVVPAFSAEIRAEGVLGWRPGFEPAPAPAGLLAGFVKLAGGDDDAVARFALVHGALELCADHGLPQAHRQPAAGERMRGCAPRREHGFYVEPTASWRRFAAEADAIVQLAGRVRAGDEARADYERVRNLVEPLSIEEDAWLGAVGEPLGMAPDVAFTLPAPDSDEEYAHWLLRWIVSERWLRLGDVRPRVELDDAERVQASLTSTGLFGALAVFLAAEVARVLESKVRPRSFATAICHECGDIYTPARRPASGRRNYCEKDACKRAARRDAQRDRRAGRSSPRKSKQREEETP